MKGRTRELVSSDYLARRAMTKTYVARVFSSLRVACTHHVFSEIASVPVRLRTHVLADDEQHHLVQDVRKVTVLGV